MDDDLEFDYALALSLEEQTGKATERSEAFLNSIDEDCDFAIALSLQEGTSNEMKGNFDTFSNKMKKDSDYAMALSLQEDMSKEAKKESPLSYPSSALPLSIVDKQWEVLDPTPNILDLFLQFNVQFFYGKLDGIEVKWSPRMTMCAGVCSYEGRGGLCSVRLSLPLLKLRPRRDLVETLLHEMIHAYLFVTANNKDHDAHGPEFLKHMSRINKETGSTISVYHSFHDEVDLYRKHIWRCDGPCQKRRPYYGYVKRAVNRAPGPKDPWWANHLSSCGGTFSKIGEPEGYQQKSKNTTRKEPAKRKPLTDADNQLSNVKKFLKTSSSSTLPKNVSTLVKTHSVTEKNTEGMKIIDNKKQINSITDSNTSSVSTFTGKGFLLGSSTSAMPKTFLANVRREIASSSSTVSKTFLGDRRKEIAASNFNNSARTINKGKQKESCILGVLTSTQNNGNGGKSISTHGLQKTLSSGSKKLSYVQSSIDKFVTSPSRPLNDANKDSNSNISANVKCPVCFEMLSSSVINSHLDTCLSLQS